MPAKSPDALARKAARKVERRKERRAELRADRPPRLKVKKSKSPKSLKSLKIPRPFVGCDGEGIGRGDQHRYALFRMGDRELYEGDRRLTTPELLRFIVDHPDQAAILVAFAFEYDVSNILRDVPHVRVKPDEPSRLERILQRSADYQAGAENPWKGIGWTWLNFAGFETFGVSYIPRNYLRVCVGRSTTLILPDGTPKQINYSVKGSIRTIYDTFGFFQSSFLAALDKWKIGDAHREAIAQGKAARATFETIDAPIRRYCRIETDLLAELMTQFRAVCVEAGTVPKTWNGAGKIAAALLDQHGMMTAKQIEDKTPKALRDMANAGYYGGRFEVTRAGKINAKVYEHDINSAYPAAMLDLPCLDHGRWRKASAGDLMRAPLDALFIAPVAFEHPPGQFLCGFPFRAKDGRLSWPRLGQGVYWSPEIRSAQRLGARCKIGGGWLFEKACDCRPFDWVQTLYERRRAIGSDTKGIPIKLGINSLYGKQAQRIGRPKYANPINAGLITALTRAKLNDAIAAMRDPRDVVMIATDALFTVRARAKVKQGDALGQWGLKRHPSMFIVRPGLYWPPKPRTKAWRLKSRGISPKFFEPRRMAFQRAWRAYAKTDDPFLVHLPKVAVEVETFVGLRLALHLGRPADACRWIRKAIDCTFNWLDKRGASRWSADRAHMILDARTGSAAQVSARYDPQGKIASSDAWEVERLFFEAMPDPVEFSPPFS